MAPMAASDSHRRVPEAGTGRTYVMQGAVHLVIFAAFLFLTFVP